MTNIEISMRIEGEGDINGDELSDAVDTMADTLGARILWDSHDEPEESTGKPYKATVELEADQWGEIVTGLHEIATQMANGHNEGEGWKLTIATEG